MWDFLSATAVLALFGVFASPAHALDVRRGDPQLTVRASETVDDTLVAFGETVNVEGVVNGDLVVFARSVNIRGSVKGNVFGFAQHIDVSGAVEGDIVGFAQTVQSHGRVGQNVFGFAQTARVSDDAQVNGNVTLFCADAAIDGAVGRDATLFASRVDIRGDVSRNVVSYSDRITLIAPGRVGGDLTAHVSSADRARIAEGATVGGKTDIRVRPLQPSRYVTLSFYIWQLIWLVGAFIVGLVLFSVFPALGRPDLESTTAVLKAGGIGLLATLATPIVAIIVGITLIGLPAALLTLGLWLAGLYLAKIVLASFIGRALLKHRAQPVNLALVLLVGLALIAVATNLPYIGGVVNVLLTIIGLGALVVALYQMLRARPAAIASS